jgi:N-methylhydantoinase B
VVLGALAACIPDRVIAASNGANGVSAFFGVGPDGKSYVYMETIGGGSGARSYKDGIDGIQVHVTNTSNLPIESLEKEYPLLIERYEFVENSGGAGRWRGGLGLRRIYRPIGHVCTFSGQGERCVHRPWGLFGGEPGGTAGFRLRTEDGQELPLPNKPTTVAVGPEATIVVTTPGAGGYGPPRERDPALVERDARSGKFDRAYIERHYAHVLGRQEGGIAHTDNPRQVA